MISVSVSNVKVIFILSRLSATLCGYTEGTEDHLSQLVRGGSELGCSDSYSNKMDLGGGADVLDLTDHLDPCVPGVLT